MPSPYVRGFRGPNRIAARVPHRRQCAVQGGGVRFDRGNVAAAKHQTFPNELTVVHPRHGGLDVAAVFGAAGRGGRAVNVTAGRPRNGRGTQPASENRPRPSRLGGSSAPTTHRRPRTGPSTRRPRARTSSGGVGPWRACSREAPAAGPQVGGGRPVPAAPARPTLAFAGAVGTRPGPPPPMRTAVTPSRPDAQGFTRRGWRGNRQPAQEFCPCSPWPSVCSSCPNRSPSPSAPRPTR